MLRDPCQGSITAKVHGRAKTLYHVVMAAAGHDEKKSKAEREAEWEGKGEKGGENVLESRNEGNAHSQWSDFLLLGPPTYTSTTSQ